MDQEVGGEMGIKIRFLPETQLQRFLLNKSGIDSGICLLNKDTGVSDSGGP